MLTHLGVALKNTAIALFQTVKQIWTQALVDPMSEKLHPNELASDEYQFAIVC
jgi:hypothetical protein